MRARPCFPLLTLHPFLQRTVMPFTIFDSRVDRISINPRKQAFEKVRLRSVSTFAIAQELTLSLYR